MACGNPHPQGRAADGELQRANKVDCLSVDAGVHNRWGLDVQTGSAPRSPRRVLRLSESLCIVSSVVRSTMNECSRNASMRYGMRVAQP